MNNNQTTEPHEPTPQAQRLQKILAHAGVASRRRAEELIVAGRVRVDGEVVTELGTRVDPRKSRIEVDGRLIRTEPLRYILLHKPSGYITTMHDERDRRTVMDLIDVEERVVPVGRLDRQTEGLLLFTNDGQLANRVMHPRYQLEKVYEAVLDGVPPAHVLDLVRRGVTVDGERTIPTFLKPVRQTEVGTIVQIGLHEGRNRIVRRIFENVDYPVVRLVRVRIGPLQLGALKRGEWRDLRDVELEQLQDAVGLNEPPPDRPPRERRPYHAGDRDRQRHPSGRRLYRAGDRDRERNRRPDHRDRDRRRRERS